MQKTGNEKNLEKSDFELLPVPEEKSMRVMRLANALDNIKSIAKGIGWSAISLSTAYLGSIVAIKLANISLAGTIVTGISTTLTFVATMNRAVSNLVLTESPRYIVWNNKN